MTPTTIANDPAALASSLAGLTGLIVFDGCDGVGKTTLAIDVASRLGCEHVDGDAHLDKKLGMYVGALRTEELRSAIVLALAKSPVAILHCVCAREVVARLELLPSAYVYVQRISMGGLPGDLPMMWAEEDGVTTIPEYFNELDRELQTYHASHKPIASADILYRRTE